MAMFLSECNSVQNTINMMNHHVCVLAFLFAVISLSISTSPPLSVTKAAQQAVNKCITSLNLDAAKINSKLQPDQLVPEDDPNFVSFYDCLWKDLRFINSDGDINDLQVIVMLTQVLEEGLTGPDAKQKAEDIAKTSVNNCKDTPKADSHGLTAIKRRNCVFQELKKLNAL